MTIFIIGLLCISSLFFIAGYLAGKRARSLIAFPYERQLNLYRHSFSLGEICDKASILELKSVLLPTLEGRLKSKALMKVVNYLMHERLREYSQDVAHQVLTKYGTLVVSNLKQWHAENNVREKQTIEACLEARQCNNLRVSLKNEINQLVKEQQELKTYPEIKT